LKHQRIQNVVLKVFDDLTEDSDKQKNEGKKSIQGLDEKGKKLNE
jgi:hypothetical protein